VEEDNDVHRVLAIVALDIDDAGIDGTEKGVAVAERGDGNREVVGLYEDFFHVEEEDDDVKGVTEVVVEDI